MSHKQSYDFDDEARRQAAFKRRITIERNTLRQQLTEKSVNNGLVGNEKKEYIECISDINISSLYTLVKVEKSVTEGDMSVVKLRKDGDVSGGDIFITGVAQTVAKAGKIVRVQIFGVTFVRVEHTGGSFIFGDPDSGASVIGIRLIPTVTGGVVKPDPTGEDVEGIGTALEDQHGQAAVIDEVILMNLDAPGAGGTVEVPVSGIISTPFQGTIHPDGDKITIGVDRALLVYPFFDTITIGKEIIHKLTPETTAVISAETFVFYTITKTNLSIVATLTIGESYPVQTDTDWIVVLGRAEFFDGAITIWTQYWFGDIMMPGRMN